MTHAEFAQSDAFFKQCCESAGVKNTKRQASKFKLGKGKAFSQRTLISLPKEGPVV